MELETPAPAEPIKAVPVRRPGRWIAVGVLIVLAAMFVHMLFTNDAFQWTFIFKNMFTRPVVEGARTTLILAILAMIVGIVFGIVLAIMRMSSNPILAGAAWLYTWIFRAVPRIVLALLFGNMGILYAKATVGIPFGAQIASLLGLDWEGEFFGMPTRDLLSAFVAGLLALALSEAAYMAEIVRAGIESIGAGQREAAEALGMTRMQTLRRIILPQAMRVIVPPTGNETIAMVKDTAVVSYVPVTNELFFQLSAVGSRTFQVFPMYVAACLWYIGLTSLLMIGQHYLEKHFARGDSKSALAKQRLSVIAAEHGRPTS